MSKILLTIVTATGLFTGTAMAQDYRHAGPQRHTMTAPNHGTYAYYRGDRAQVRHVAPRYGRVANPVFLIDPPGEFAPIAPASETQ